MANFMCKKCGDTDIYLQEKGNAVGAYCASCGSWHKWIGKKELPMYQRMGKAVHKEGIVITLKQQPVGVMPSNPKPSQLQQVPYSSGHRTSVPGNMGVAGEPEWVNKVNKTVEEEEVPFDIIEEKRGNSDCSVEMSSCPICNGENLEAVGDAQVDVMIFDGVLTITDKEGVDILGTYRLKACPICGKKY